jgi:hypothetical protein
VSPLTPIILGRDVLGRANSLFRFRMAFRLYRWARETIQSSSAGTRLNRFEYEMGGLTNSHMPREYYQLSINPPRTNTLNITQTDWFVLFNFLRWFEFWDHNYKCIVLASRDLIIINRL